MTSLNPGRVTTFCGLVLILLAGCATTNPYGGGQAPVVDRSVGVQDRAAGPATAGVEVMPLPRDDPMAPGGEGLLLEDSPGASGPPEIQRQPKPKPRPVASNGRANTAVVALLDSAANHVGNNDLEKAAADLERALRIEPKNAAIWHDLGQIRLHQRQYSQAEAMASKSNSLAAGNRSLQARNWRLIGISRRSQGDVAGADAADAKAVQLES